MVWVSEKWEGVFENEFQGHFPFNHLAGWAAKQSQKHTYLPSYILKELHKKFEGLKSKVEQANAAESINIPQNGVLKLDFYNKFILSELKIKQFSADPCRAKCKDQDSKRKRRKGGSEGFQIDNESHATKSCEESKFWFP